MARRYALVVGISEYQSPPKPLSKPASDAEAVAAVLKQFGNFQDVTSLKGSVTHTKLIRALRTLLLEQAKNNDVLIYFTGHGIPVVDPVIGKPKAYLATSDTIITLEGKQVTEARRAVPLDSLNALIQESQLSSLVMLFDSCHSGDFLERSLVEKTFTAFSTHKDYYLITACRGFEQAYAIKREQHSIFTGALLAGLSQANANDDGQVTGDRLFECIARELKGSGQEPIRMGYGGLITLVNYQPQPKAVEAIVDETGEPICPYQGLQAFTAEQQAFFFGRQRTVEDIRRRLEQHSFVPIIGASGSGKSSVVRAGLMPWLAEAGWQILPLLKPGFDPLAVLKAVFEPYFKRSKQEIQQLHQLIKSELNPLPALVDRLCSTAANSHAKQTDRFLLVVDQFEEVFTLCPDEGDCKRFIDLLTGVEELADARLAVVTTMRADFLEPCLRYPVLHQLIQSQAMFMPPLNGIDLRDVIVEPAERQGYSIEDKLLFKIQEDVGKEPGFLPLLEFALTKLWEERDTKQKLLTLEQYKNLEGLTGALNLHAERVYQYQDFDSESPKEHRSASEQEWIKRILLLLVRTGEAEKDTRQRRPKTELLALAGTELTDQNMVRGLIEDNGGLVQGRLLVTGQEQASSESWVDLAHEALLDGWKRFAEWRKADREMRRLVDRVEDALREWKKEPTEANLMMGGLLLHLKENWEVLEPGLNDSIREFYSLSSKHEIDRITELEVALSKAVLREQAAKVLNLLSDKSVDGIYLAIKTAGENLQKIPNEVLSEVQSSLHRAMELSRNLIPIPLESRSIYLCGQYKNHGHLILDEPDNNWIIPHWYGSGLDIPPSEIARTAIWSVAFSPDGKLIASGSGDGRIRLWSLEGKPLIQHFGSHKSPVVSVTFSPNGKLMASGSGDGVSLWNLKGELIIQPFRGHQVYEDYDCVKQQKRFKSVTSVAFSPDGKLIASGGEDETIRLWDLEGNPIEVPFTGHKGVVTSVAFNPNGQNIISGSSDKTLCLWDLKGNIVGQPFTSHKSIVTSVAFSPNGQNIISGSSDRTLCLWNLKGELINQPWQGHQDKITCVAYSPDGTRIISSSFDQTIRVWNFQGDLITSINYKNRYEQPSGLTSVAFSPSGQIVVSGGHDGTIHLLRSGWQTWLEACCERLRYNNISKSPHTELEKAACETCRKYVWNEE